MLSHIHINSRFFFFLELLSSPNRSQWPLERKKEGVEVGVGEAVKRNFEKECWT